MHFWGGTKNPHHLSFSPESTLLFPITSPLLPGSPRSAEHQFSRSVCFFVLSFHHALFSHPPGDDAEQRSPWGLATLYVSLRLHHALVRWWVGEGRVSTGTRQLWPGLVEQTGLLDEPQVSTATPEPPPAWRGPQRPGAVQETGLPLAQARGRKQQGEKELRVSAAAGTEQPTGFSFAQKSRRC